MDAASARPLSCSAHPERPAHARCMSCQKVLCAECATEWEGINHCRRCLEARSTARGRSGVFTGAILVVLIAALLFAHARVLAWMGAAAASVL